jgi:hypothetical protein
VNDVAISLHQAGVSNRADDDPTLRAKNVFRVIGLGYRGDMLSAAAGILRGSWTYWPKFVFGGGVEMAPSLTHELLACAEAKLKDAESALRADPANKWLGMAVQVARDKVESIQRSVLEDDGKPGAKVGPQAGS